jgi:hypothetical protein
VRCPKLSATFERIEPAPVQPRIEPLNFAVVTTAIGRKPHRVPAGANLITNGINRGRIGGRLLKRAFIDL